MNNKLAIAIVALMVAALAAPAVMAADVSYSANVGSAANVVVSGEPDSAFGGVSAGTTHTKSPSIILINSGNAVGTVTAQFTTNVSGNFGMISGTEVIPANALTIDEQALDNSGSSVTLSSVPPHAGSSDGTVSYNATLTIPLGQTPVEYTGNVLLTFGSG